MQKTVVQKTLCVRTALAFAVLAAGLSVATLFSVAVTDAQARERNRTLKILFTHTGEKGEFTFKRNGRYDRAVLNKLNTILRDWRRNEPTRMDPQLFDLLWEVYQKTGSREYIHVVSGYRSLATNNMLRRRSRAVAKRSRHTQGRAIDFFIPGVPVSKLRKVGLKIEKGGVGYYPSSRAPFVHMDTGSIRHWPRMSHAQLAAVFPNGGTLHVPSDGKPLPGYKRALARAGKTGKNTTVAYLDPRTRSIRVNGDGRKKITMGKWLKKVFTGGADEEEDDALAGAGAAPANRPAAPLDLGIAVAGASPGSDDERSSAPLPRNVPVKTRMIRLAAAERSQIAAADELAMIALVATPQFRSAAVAATTPAKAHERAARFETAILAIDDTAIAAPDRSALAALYLAAARRAAALAPDKAKTEPTVTAALPALRPAELPIATNPSYALAATIPAPSQASYNLASADPEPMPAHVPVRLASFSPIAFSPVALPRAAPPASAAADAPGSAIEAANALGLVGTQNPHKIDPGVQIELAYASAGATALDGPATKPHPRLKPKATNAAKPANAGNAGSAPAYPAVTVNAHLETVAPSANDLRRFMSQTTTRTRAFAMLKRPRPDRVPGFYIAPKSAAQAILPTAVKPPRTDRFVIDGKSPVIRSQPPLLAGLY